MTLENCPWLLLKSRRRFALVALVIFLVAFYSVYIIIQRYRIFKHYKRCYRDGLSVDLHMEDAILGHAGHATGHTLMDYYDSFASCENYTAIIAIGLSITSKGVKNPYAVDRNFQFFNTFLTSFCKTANFGYRYDIYLAYDHTDPVFSKVSFLDTFRGIFREIVRKNCADEIITVLHMVECDHTKKPTWAQNDAMLEAYLDNADYYYRINDDTLLQTGDWTNAFIERLGKYNPSNVGVVGPTHTGGNMEILTYDFVHRKHIDIFGYYYPRLFTDWWGDNWITEVYGTDRMSKLSSVHLSHTLNMGQRYKVDYSVKDKLPTELKKGKRTLARYLRSLNETSGKNFGRVSDGTKIISMSLYGKDPVYTWGAIRNAQLTPVYFPGWKLRFYIYDESSVMSNQTTNKLLSVPGRVIRKLHELGAEMALVQMASNISSVIPPQLWRYLVIDDPKVEYFLIRDADSRLSNRDAFVVNEWLKSDGQVGLDMPKSTDGKLTNTYKMEVSNVKKAALHCIRDHPKHADRPMVDGLWGGHAPSIRKLFSLQNGQTLSPILKRYYFKSSNPDIKIDSIIKIKLINFATSFIWPLLKSKSMCHDSTSCETMPGGSGKIRPIRPIRHPSTEYLGQKYCEHHELTSKDGKVLEGFVAKKCNKPNIRGTRTKSN